MAQSTVDKRALIEGERPLFNASFGKLMMWFFLVSDAFTFSGLLIAYGVTRVRAVSRGFAWANPEEVFTHAPILHEVFHIDAPLVFVGLMTFILILSSVFMVLAVEAGHRKSKKEVQKWVFWTIVGGVAFLSCQAYEWYHFISGTPKGAYMVSASQLEESGPFRNNPELEDLKKIVFYPGSSGADLAAFYPGHEGDHGHGEGEHAEGDHGDGHGGGHGEANSFVLRSGLVISDPEVVELIKDEASHWHDGTYAMDLVELRKIEAIPLNEGQLQAAASIKLFPVYSTEGALIKLRNNLGGIESEDLIKSLSESYETNKLGSLTSQGGANLKVNEYGPAAFADLFFFVTGFHGTHVFSGVVLLVILYLMTRNGVFERRGHYEMVEKIGLYWHFVDLVWVFVFTFYYLI